jgi:hypothetical protein
MESHADPPAELSHTSYITSVIQGLTAGRLPTPAGVAQPVQKKALYLERRAPRQGGERRSSQVTEDLTLLGESYPTILALRTRAGGTGTPCANMAAEGKPQAQASALF